MNTDTTNKPNESAANSHDSVGQTDKHDIKDPSFFDKPRNVNIILYSFYAICALLVVLDFVVHRHIYVDFEKIPAFYALYGFVACVLLVVLAKLMRLVLMRPEDYYDPRDDENNDGESHQ